MSLRKRLLIRLFAPPPPHLPSHDSAAQRAAVRETHPPLKTSLELFNTSSGKCYFLKVLKVAFISKKVLVSVIPAMYLLQIDTKFCSIAHRGVTFILKAAGELNVALH